jgi:hypothetical protein
MLQTDARGRGSVESRYAQLTITWRWSGLARPCQTGEGRARPRHAGRGLDTSNRSPPRAPHVWHRLALVAVTLVVSRGPASEGRSHVHMHRADDVPNRTIIGAFTARPSVLDEPQHTPQTPRRLPKHVRYRCATTWCHLHDESGVTPLRVLMDWCHHMETTVGSNAAGCDRSAFEKVVPIQA